MASIQYRLVGKIIWCFIVKKIVCHITSAHPANDIRIFHKECVSLVENGYEVHLVAAGKMLQDAKGVIHHPMTIEAKWPRLGQMIIRSWKAYRLAKLTKATVYHIHDPELLPYGLLLKWQGNFVIYDAHEDLPRDVMMKEWIPRYLRKITAWLVERVEHFIVRRIDHVVCATPFICKRFQQIGAKAIDVKNYPKMGEFALISAAISLNDNFPRICYVGMISLPRGILEMIQSIEKLDVRLIIAGAFIDSKTEKIVRALPGWSKVDFRGIVSRQEIATIFAQSSLGLCIFHPSTAHNEALPNKLFEYMSAGLPTVSSNFLIWSSIVEKEQCGLCVDPMSILEIGNAIQWILENPSKSKEMGRQGKNAIDQFYNWEFEAERLIGTYRCLLENR